MTTRLCEIVDEDYQRFGRGGAVVFARSLGDIVRGVATVVEVRTP